MISASLLEKAGFTVRIIDGRVDRDWHEEIRCLAPESHWIGLTSSPLDRWQCPNLEIRYFVDLARSLPSEKLLVMGTHGSIFPRAMLSQTRARAVIVGEPEERLLALVTQRDWSTIPGIVFRRDGKTYKTGRARPTNLADLPAPAFHLIEPYRYVYELLGRPFALFEASRGCPCGCTFCLKTMYGPGVRYKPIERLMEEIERAVMTSAFRYGYFIDLEFTTNRDRILELCDRLIARNYPFIWCCQTRADAVDALLLERMKRAGCRLIHYGVESGSSRILKDTQKGIDRDAIQKGIRLTHEAGIEAACFFMLGFPGETRSEMEETIEFARNLNPTYASFHAVTPYPGTAIGALASSSPNALDSDMSFPACCEGHSSLFLNKMIRKAYMSYYMRPAYIGARLKQPDPVSLLRQLRLFLGFLR